jgi:hypothetical protein
MMKRQGLVPWNTDLDKLTVDLLTEQIAGFYDPVEKKLYVADKPEGDAGWADMLMARGSYMRCRTSTSISRPG